MRVLVCGGRSFADYDRVQTVLDGLNATQRIEVLIHGGANGVDSLAGRWARERGVPVMAFKALWDRDGRAAGVLRNQRMLDEGKPELVIAFPGGRGTADMVRRAHAAGVFVHGVLL